MAGGCQPNFFIIGGAKCGTTSLHHYLNQHPDISMSSVKEPCVFAEPHWLDKHEDYEGMFDCEAPLRGEASTAYTRYPVEGDAAARISEAVPDARFIYLIRDPLDRIMSDYVQLVAVGVEQRPVDEALRDYRDPSNIYSSASRYAMQAARYLEHFDSSALLVVEQSDLRARRPDALRRIFEFLGADPDFSSPHFDAELFSREDYVRYRGAWWKLRTSALGRAFRKLPPGCGCRSRERSAGGPGVYLLPSSIPPSATSWSSSSSLRSSRCGPSAASRRWGRSPAGSVRRIDRSSPLLPGRSCGHIARRCDIWVWRRFELAGAAGVHRRFQRRGRGPVARAPGGARDAAAAI